MILIYPHAKLETPTDTPVQNKAYPQNSILRYVSSSLSQPSGAFFTIFPTNIIAIMIP